MPVPGQVTGNVIGSTFQNMSPEAERRMYELEDERKRRREAANAVVMAQRTSAQQAAREAADRERVRQAFNQTYGPQLQRSYQDVSVASAPTNTAAGKARDFAIGHGFQYGGMIGQPNTDIVEYAKGKLPQPEMSQAQLANTLDYMWRQQTDPYQRTANKMGGMMTLFQPSDAPVREWGATMGKRPSGGRSGVGKTTAIDSPLPTVEEWKKKYPRE